MHRGFACQPLSCKARVSHQFANSQGAHALSVYLYTDAERNDSITPVYHPSFTIRYRHLRTKERVEVKVVATSCVNHAGSSLAMV